MPSLAAARNVDTSPDDRSRYARSERLGRRIMEYKAWLNAGEYRWLMLVREFDEEKLWADEGVLSCAHWLNWKCGIGRNAAREKVRVAHALAKLPKVSARYARGELSYSKVRAITRIATAENEDYLLMIARHGTAAHVEELVAKYRGCQRRQQARAARKQHACRELTWFYDDDGSFVLRGRFPAEQGALIMKALQAAADQHEKEVRAEREYLDAEAAKAAASAADTRVSGVSAETPSPTRDRLSIIRDRHRKNPWNAVRPAQSWAARRADALARVAESWLAHGPEASQAADRYQVVLHVSAETLRKEVPKRRVSAETPTNGAPTQDSRCAGEASAGAAAAIADLFRVDLSYIEDGPHVSAETARRVACDASLVRVVDDENGEPLTIGRKSRSIPPAIRRALRLRDDGCRFPGFM